MRYSDGFEGRQIQSLMETYSSLGNILNQILSDPDLEKLKGIKGEVLSLNIHTSHMKDLISNIHQKLSEPVPEEERGEYAETETPKEKPECEVHIWNSDRVCNVCGVSQVEANAEG